MRLLLHISAAVLFASACAGGSGSGGTSPDAGQSVRVENRSSSDMDIYLRRSSDRSTVRIGFVPASDTADIPLPRTLTAGSSSFRLEARPVRAGGSSPEPSEPFQPGRGEIFWSIPPF
jgi:hypothetical protein